MPSAVAALLPRCPDGGPPLQTDRKKRRLSLALAGRVNALAVASPLDVADGGERHGETTSP
jgi:hypothetical protein